MLGRWVRSAPWLKGSWHVHNDLIRYYFYAYVLFLALSWLTPWLRHTMGSCLADSIDLRHVRDTFGHASLSTTSIYLHAEDDQRHAAISASHRLGWG